MVVAPTVSNDLAMPKSLTRMRSPSRAAGGEDADGVDADDVLGLEAPQDGGPLGEAPGHARVVPPVLGQHLDGDVSIQRFVVAEPHGREAARAEKSVYAQPSDALGL